MTTPTWRQITETLGRLAELCDGQHRELAHTPLAWPCSLQLATSRADDYSGVLKSSQGGGGGSSVSDPVSGAVCAGPPRVLPDDVRPPAYNCDQILHDTTAAVVRDMHWILIRTAPAQPSIRPAVVAMLARSIMDRPGLRHLAEYEALLVDGHRLIEQVLELCATDRSMVKSQTRRVTQAQDCRACSRPVAGTAQDRIRAGYCDACRKAWEREGRPDRLRFEQQRPAWIPPVEPVHIDPTQPIPAPL